MGRIRTYTHKHTNTPRIEDQWCNWRRCSPPPSITLTTRFLPICVNPKSETGTETEIETEIQMTMATKIKRYKYKPHQHFASIRFSISPSTLLPSLSRCPSHHLSPSLSPLLSLPHSRSPTFGYQLQFSLFHSQE